MSRHFGNPSDFERSYRAAEGSVELGKSTAGKPTWRGDLVIMAFIAFAGLCLYWWLF